MLGAQTVVVVKEPGPSVVTKAEGACSGADDVGEKRGGEHWSIWDVGERR